MDQEAHGIPPPTLDDTHHYQLTRRYRRAIPILTSRSHLLLAVLTGGLGSTAAIMGTRQLMEIRRFRRSWKVAPSASVISSAIEAQGPPKGKTFLPPWLFAMQQQLVGKRKVTLTIEYEFSLPKSGGVNDDDECVVAGGGTTSVSGENGYPAAVFDVEKLNDSKVHPPRKLRGVSSFCLGTIGSDGSMQQLLEENPRARAIAEMCQSGKPIRVLYDPLSPTTASSSRVVLSLTSSAPSFSSGVKRRSPDANAFCEDRAPQLISIGVRVAEKDF